MSYTDNGNGTFMDNLTKLMWEKKLASDGSDGGNCADPTQANRSVHCVNNTYTWSITSPAANGTLFTVFLSTLNNTCAGDETTTCTSDTNCTGIGNGKCGFAGHRDWRIPNAKELESIVDYFALTKTNSPASSVPGPTFGYYHWSATARASGSLSPAAYTINFGLGEVNITSKILSVAARAVRP